MRLKLEDLVHFYAFMNLNAKTAPSSRMAPAPALINPEMSDNWSRMTLHIAILFCAAVPLLAAAVTAELTVVPSVDLKRYVGKWYEIARFPNRFQKACVSDVSATYSLRPDGKITVLNQCVTAKGEVTSATGRARLAGKGQPNTKLKVTFFWPFSGNYWIIDLDPEYRWAVVGEPKREYLWVLSRTPQLPEAVYDQLIARAKQKGFDVSRLVKTPQSGR